MVLEVPPTRAADDRPDDSGLASRLQGGATGHHLRCEPLSQHLPHAPPVAPAEPDGMQVGYRDPARPDELRRRALPRPVDDEGPSLHLRAVQEAPLAAVGAVVAAIIDRARAEQAGLDLGGFADPCRMAGADAGVPPAGKGTVPAGEMSRAHAG
jgi:hypothetical protein